MAFVISQLEMVYGIVLVLIYENLQSRHPTLIVWLRTVWFSIG